MSSDPPKVPDQPPSTPKPPPPASDAKLTRTGALWAALIAGFLILIVLLIFVTQNSEPATVHFLGWTATGLQQGVLILLAAVGGGLVTVLAGTARIVQLRRAAKKLTRQKGH